MAIDLPGIGGSTTAPASGDKRALARVVAGTIAALGLERVTLVGHDVGGMVTYAFLHTVPDRAAPRRADGVAVPGVEPWMEVKRNPLTWHFAFHSIPTLPETLVAGRQAEYFAWFYDRLWATPRGASRPRLARGMRRRTRPAALRAGFDWYRAFPEDERNNMAVERQVVDTPVLYLRGDKDPGFGLDRYVEGLRQGGLRDVRGETIQGCGHFAPEEQVTRTA